MAVFLVVVSLLNRWELESLFELWRTPSPSPITSLAVHLAISGVYGIVYGLFYGMALTRAKGSPPGWLLLFSSTVYGALIWLLAVMVIIPRTDGFFESLPTGYLISAHLLYGIIFRAADQKKWQCPGIVIWVQALEKSINIGTY